MPKTLEQVRQDASELTRKERFQLAHDLLDGCDEDAESPAEIQKRLEDAKSGRARFIPVEETMRRIEESLFRSKLAESYNDSDWARIEKNCGKASD